MKRLQIRIDDLYNALARALRIREVLAFDGDFSAAGFIELRPCPAD